MVHATFYFYEKKNWESSSGMCNSWREYVRKQAMQNTFKSPETMEITEKKKVSELKCVIFHGNGPRVQERKKADIT